VNFQAAVELVLKLEGGARIVSHPKDPGGLTKYGISLKAHPELGPAGIRNLTREAAIAIYRKDYWEPLGLDRFAPELALPLFDAAVNLGVSSAARVFQKALVRLGLDLKVDGVLGPKTAAAAGRVPSRSLLAVFLTERLSYYRSLEAYETFGFGWDRRIIEIALAS
jgi:lysozyme family protein